MLIIEKIKSFIYKVDEFPEKKVNPIKQFRSLNCYPIKSDSSWYAKFGNMETHQNPIDLFTSHVRTRSLLERSQKPNEEKNSISKIIERRLNMDFDEPWLNKERIIK